MRERTLSDRVSDRASVENSCAYLKNNGRKGNVPLPAARQESDSFSGLTSTTCQIIGQTPVRESDKRRRAFRTEADTEAGGQDYNISNQRTRVPTGRRTRGAGGHDASGHGVSREYGSNSTYPARHPVGSVVERRIHERVNNYNDLSRLARRLFALDTADSIHLLIDLIDVDQDRKAA